MKKLIVLFITFPTLLFCQGWEKTYGKGAGLSIRETTDGGYIISGCTLINDYPEDTYLIKTNENGDTLWTKTYGGIGTECSFSVQQTMDGGFLITGLSDSYGTSEDVHLIKTNILGDTLWTKLYGGIYSDMGHSAQQTTDSGYIITGGTNNPGNGYDVYLIKTNKNGDTLWTKTYGGTDDDRGYSVVQTNDGGYIITGYTESDSTAYDVYIIKTNENGDTLWTKTYGGNFYDIGWSVQQTIDGGFIVTGEISNSANKDVCLIKTNNYGDFLWTKTYDGNYNASGRSVIQTTDSSYIIAGSTGSIENGHKVYLIKTNGNGDTIWTKTYGKNYNNLGRCVVQTTDGMYVITGSTFDDSSGKEFVYLIKTDIDGNILSTAEIQVPNPKRKLIKLIDFNGREITKPQKKIPYIEVYDDGTTQKKMIIK